MFLAPFFYAHPAASAICYPIFSFKQLRLMLNCIYVHTAPHIRKSREASRILDTPRDSMTYLLPTVQVRVIYRLLGLLSRLTEGLLFTNRFSPPVPQRHRWAEVVLFSCRGVFRRRLRGLYIGRVVAYHVSVQHILRQRGLRGAMLLVRTLPSHKTLHIVGSYGDMGGR